MALREWRSDEVFASAVTRYELRYGASLRDDGGAFWARLEADILRLVNWLPISQQTAERGGEIAAELRRQGRPSGDLDPLLAATAMEYPVAEPGQVRGGAVDVAPAQRDFKGAPRAAAVFEDRIDLEPRVVLIVEQRCAAARAHGRR